MKTRFFLAVMMFVVVGNLVTGQTSQQNPVLFFVTIEGSRQGRFKGESERERARDQIEGLKYSYEVKSPHDAASGQAAGRRQHSPVTITKAWGAATPQIFQALVTNEPLGTVLMEFVRTNERGEEEVFHTVRLTNARVSDIQQYTDNQRQVEDVSFTFQKIEISNALGRTAAQDEVR